MAASDVITVDDVRDHLNMTGTVDNLELAVHVTAASELVEQFVGPVIIRQFTDRDRYGSRIALDRRPVVSLVSVTDVRSGAARDVTQLRAEMDSGVIRFRTGGRLSGGPFDVVYTAGRATTVNEVPDALGLACRVIVAHLWETQRAVTFGGTPGLSPDDFSAAPFGGSGSGFAVPYRARDLMAPFMPVLVA